MKTLRLVLAASALVFALAGGARAQLGPPPIGSNASTGSSAVSGITGPPTNGLIARYEIPSTDTASALTDSSGSGNSGTGTVGTAPSIGALGGLVCSGAGASILPSSLNGALTIALYVTAGSSKTGTYNSSIIQGNGNGTTSGAIGIQLSDQTIIGPDINVNRFQIVGNNALKTTPLTGFQGTGTIVLELGALDHLYLNGVESTYQTQGASVGLQTQGQYQLCGAAFGSGFSNQTYAQHTTINKAYFYNRLLTQAEINQLTNYWNTIGAISGSPYSIFSPNAPAPQVVGEGDSQMDGIQGCNMTCYFATMKLWNAAYTAVNHGVPAMAAFDVINSPAYTYGNYCNPTSQDNLSLVVLGANDIKVHADTAQQALVAVGQAMHYWLHACPGARVILGTEIDSVTSEATIQAFDTLLLQNWRAMGAVGLADFVSDPQLGATNAHSNTTYFFSDGIHANSNGNINDEAFIAQRSVNAAIGNLDWNTATTYTTGATAAVATTAVTEATNTVTVTFAATPANCQAGNLLILAGVTPTTYNSTAANGAGLGGWMILTRTATTVTAYNPTTGLGNATIQGTGVCA